MTSCERGFSLIGTLVAMVLLMVAVGAMSSTALQTVTMHVSSEARTHALAIASSYLENVKTRNPHGLASENEVSIDMDGSDNSAGRFRRKLEVMDEPELENTKRVIVTVEYPSGLGRTRTVSLVTIIYQGVTG